MATVANGPVNLLEAMGVEVLYRKTLTPYAWGTLLFDHLYVICHVTSCHFSSRNTAILIFAVVPIYHQHPSNTPFDCLVSIPNQPLFCHTSVFSVAYVVCTVAADMRSTP